jgi:hypothetical protein
MSNATEQNSGDASTALARIVCRLAVAAPTEGVQAGRLLTFMVMPAGVHTIHAERNGRRATVRVQVDRASAAALQQQLQIVNGRSAQRAFFDFDHEDKAASAWPLEFLWQDGLRAGVYCRAELSEQGERAILGRTYRAFSPVFSVDQSDPARVVCNGEADLNFGGLVNDPAFQTL